MINEVIVDQFEWANVSFPDTIRSGGLYPCIAVGLLDTKFRRAYLNHESNPSQGDRMPTFLDGVLEKSAKVDLQVYVTGAIILDSDDDEDKEYVLKNRKYVEDLVRKYFEDGQTRICWLPASALGGELIILSL